MDFDAIAKAFVANMKITPGPGSKIQELIDYASMALQGAYNAGWKQGAADQNAIWMDGKMPNAPAKDP